MCPEPESAPANGNVNRGGHHAGSPYQSVGDFLSNTNRFQIIESTLREGEQFANAFFDTEAKIKMLARAQLRFYLTLTNTVALPQRDCSLRLRC